MKLDYTLSQEYELALRGALMDEAINYCVPFDISMALGYTEGFVVLTDTRLFVLEEKRLIEAIVLDDTMSFEMQEQNASGVLEMTRDGIDRPLVCFSMEHIPKFSAISKILMGICRNEAVFISGEDEEKHCPTCGKPFLRRTRFCVNCGSKTGTFLRLAGFAKPFWVYYLIIIGLFWAVSAIMMVQPVINRYMVTDILDPATKKEPDLGLLIWYVALLGLCSLSTLLLNVARTLVSTVASSRLMARMREIIHAKIQSLSINYIEQKKTGALMSRVTRDTERIQWFIDFVLINGLNTIILLLVVIITLFAMNWQMAILVILPTPLMLYIIRIWFTFRKFYHIQWHFMDRCNVYLNDIIRGIRVVKAFGQEEKAITRFRAESAMLRDTTIRNESRYYTMMPIAHCIFTFGGLLLILYCGNRVLDAGMTIGQMIQLTTYGSYFYQRIDYLIAMPHWLTQAVVNAQRVFEVLDTPSMNAGEQDRVIDIKGKMKFEHVTFGYLSYKDVLKDICLDVDEGEMIGLVGHSGAGKSTLINLVMRMFEPQSGRITVDGEDISRLNREYYQSQLGVVLQETFLFSGTILSNLRYAKPDASMEEVVKAAKAANAHEFIMRQPFGYETFVGENGANLSGGERQRIAIARAILVNPRILILDEATASVDTETEKQIQDALRRIVRDRTTFAIAHRLSTLKNANRIVVLDHGAILEMGEHKELIDKQGKYYELVMAQKMLSSVAAVENAARH